ncbi:MAG: DUF4384 domain-containing protein [Longimicrobiales bacterium]
MTRIPSILAAAVVLAAGPAAGQDARPEAPGLEARVWLDRGTDPVLSRGDRVRIYYRASDDAHVAIFHIDTDGVLRMLHPRGPGEDAWIRGERDYRVLFPRTPYWYVDEYEGKGYFFAVASPEPFDFREVRHAGTDGAWDLSGLGGTVYSDPYLAIDDVVAGILPGWETIPYALDFISYDVGGAHEYPRFLCYQCHGFRSYAAWNPYTYACTDFRVVVWNDPYFLPAYRYGPTRVVYSSALRGRARFEFKPRAAGEAWSPLTRTRQPPVYRSTEYLEPSAAAPPPARIVPPRRRVVPSGPARSSTDAGRRSSTDGSLRRPGSGAGVLAPPARRNAGALEPARSGTARPTPARGRPVLERRPARPTRPGAVRPPPSREPSATRRGGSVGIRTPSGAVGRRPATRPASPTRGGTRVVTPRRPSGAGVRPARPGSSRPTVRPSTGRARPPVRRPPPRPKKKPGG